MFDLMNESVGVNCGVYNRALYLRGFSLETSTYDFYSEIGSRAEVLIDTENVGVPFSSRDQSLNKREKINT